GGQLSVKKILIKNLRFGRLHNSFREFLFAGTGDVPEGRRPIRPSESVEMFLKGDEQGIIFQPGGLMFTEGFQTAVGVKRVRASFRESGVGLTEDRKESMVESTIIHRIAWQGTQVRQLVGLNQTAGFQRGQIDEIWISGKSGKTLVRG